ncbi:MAG TPA: NAD(+)/NADH kinase, partial [Bacteroidales bacterium]|nr:NAD(+)/NADH kinase [Bacteroidales bacterium]
MNVALFGKTISENDLPYLQIFIDRLGEIGGKVLVYAPFLEFLSGKVHFPVEAVAFSVQADIEGKADYLFSIGGDGTLLDTITLVGNSGIPLIGINMGRMGFLSSIPKNEILPAMEEILQRNYIIEQRTLLKLESPEGLFGAFNYGLNDLTIYKKGPLSMLTIRTYVNDEYLNTYWADGLIVATPTGSTAYSLSCTGPIITPESENFVITPIASHNLTVRPIVIPDSSVIRIEVQGRDVDYFAGL